MLYKTLESLFDKPFVTDLMYPVLYEDGVFLLSDGSLGLAWEIEGINIDGKSAEELERISATFANFLKVLPEETPCQLLAFTWRGLANEELSVYSNGDFSNDYIKAYMDRKLAWHEHGKRKSFASEGTVFYPRTIKTYFTVKQHSQTPGKLYTEESYKKTLEKLKSVELIVDASLSAGGIGHRLINADELIEMLYRFLNPKRSLDIPPQKWTGGNDLRRYTVFNSPESREDGWIFDGMKYSVLSFASNPALPQDDGFYTFPNILFKENNTGASFFDYAPVILFAINFHQPSQAALKRQLEVKRTFAFLHKFNFLGDVSIDKEIASNETKTLLTEMYGGEKVFKVSYHLCIPTTVEESNFFNSQLEGHLNITTGCNAFREDLIASAILMRCLPFGYDHKIVDEERLVRRAIIATASVIADVAPIYRSGRGKKTDVAIGYYNRRGESVWLDLFDKSTAITAPHCLVTGATGAGKSVTMCDFIHQSLRQPATVIVIDKGESYKRACYLYGGQYLKFEGEPDFVLNPFKGDFTDDHRAFLTSLTAAMASGGHEIITREEVSFISEAILELTGLYDDSRDLGNLVRILKSYNNPISDSVARKLFPFHGSGQYARFLEGQKPHLQFTNNFTVCELGDVEIYKDLQAVIVYLLIFYITEYVKHIPGRKYLIIDEAWALFKNDVAVDFLVKATKTFRKYGCAVIFVTQQLDDFMVIARAMNMKDNCPNKILLYQEGDVVIKNAGQLDLSQGMLDIYKSIKKSPKYAEALIATQGWVSVGRITLDPESYWVVTTSEPDKSYLNDLLKQGKTLREAIAEAARNYPYGVTANSLSKRKAEEA